MSEDKNPYPEMLDVIQNPQADRLADHFENLLKQDRLLWQAEDLFFDWLGGVEMVAIGIGALGAAVIPVENTTWLVLSCVPAVVVGFLIAFVLVTELPRILLLEDSNLDGWVVKLVRKRLPKCVMAFLQKRLMRRIEKNENR